MLLAASNALNSGNDLVVRSVGIEPTSNRVRTGSVSFQPRTHWRTQPVPIRRPSPRQGVAPPLSYGSVGGRQKYRSPSPFEPPRISNALASPSAVPSKVADSGGADPPDPCESPRCSKPLGRPLPAPSIGGSRTHRTSHPFECLLLSKQLAEPTAARSILGIGDDGASRTRHFGFADRTLADRDRRHTTRFPTSNDVAFQVVSPS